MNLTGEVGENLGGFRFALDVVVYGTGQCILSSHGTDAYNNAVLCTDRDSNGRWQDEWYEDKESVAGDVLLHVRQSTLLAESPI